MVLYKVQVGAYAIKRNAEKQAAKVIAKLGIRTTIVREGIIYKVQCGAFSQYGNAVTMVNKLRKAGFNVVIKAVTTEPESEDKKEEYVENHRTRIWAINFMDENESLYGDATAIIEYGADNKTIEHVVLIDTATSASTTVKKLKKAGVTTIDAVVISHAHGDHYGALTDVFKNFKVKALYLPDCTQLDKYQRSYGNAIRNQAKKAKQYGAVCTYLKAGSSFTVGSTVCECVYQLPASAVSEHDSHHFVNNESIVTRFTIDGTWVYHSAGDLQNAGNNALIKAVKNLKADIFKIQWHGDANACNEAIAKAISPKVAFSNYHHKEGSGRGTTRKRLEKFGALVMRNHEDGDIYIDCVGNKMIVTCSKNSKFRKEFTK